MSLTADIRELILPCMTTTAIKFIETLINDLEARATKATGEERARLLKAADHYAARMPASWHRAQA